MLSLGTWSNFAVLSIAAGLGGGALVGSTFGRGSTPESERNLKLAGLLMGMGLGLSGGIVVAVVNDSMALKATFLVLGAIVGCAMAVPGRLLGLWFRPSVSTSRS